jgi:hypothetical protein
MSVDTIYKRQFLSFQQAALHELIGVNVADVRQLQDEIIDKSDKFTKGIMPENEAADFARETGEKALEYEIHAKEELQRLQEQKKPSVEKFLGGLSEEQKNLIRNEIESMSEITALENLIAELKRLCEMAWCFTGHIQDYAATPEYRERHRNFLRMGDTAPDTQSPEQKAVPALTDTECLQRLSDTGYIMINPHIKDRVAYLIKKSHNTLDTFDELAKTTGSELRARSIMFQNMTGVQGTLNKHRPKHTLKT